MRDRKTTREHFAPTSKDGAYFSPYDNVDPAQVDRFEFRHYTPQEIEENKQVEEEELEMA